MSGQAFFSGATLIVLACLVCTSHTKRMVKVVLHTVGIVGFALVFLSATPKSLWFYGIWIVTFIAWLILGLVRFSHKPKYISWVRLPVVIICVLSVLWELPYHRKPSVPKRNHDISYILGDSISAGIGGRDEHVWPDIICEQHHVNIVNLAQSGATLESAMKQTQKVEAVDCLVLLEIGGNDLLSKAPLKEFEAHLENLLNAVSSPKRTIFMLELPLFPFYNEYGRIQRLLARKYNVILVPKRFLASVLFCDGATVDGIHLSSEGHRLMADMIWNIISDCFGD